MNVSNTTKVKKLPSLESRGVLKNSYELSKNLLGFVHDKQKQYGDIFYVNAIRKDLCFVTHPDYIKYILQENNKNYRKSFGYDILKLFLGNGLLTSEGDFWLKQRRLAQPTFHKERLAALVNKMAENTQEMVDKWTRLKAEGKTINICDEMNEITLEIVTNSLISSDISSDVDDLRKAIYVANEFAMKRIQNPLRLPMWVPLPSHLVFKSENNRLNKFFQRVFDERRSGKVVVHDMLQMLMDVKDEDTGETMSDLQLRDEIATIFVAGHETTANALAWAWYLLAKHPEVQQKVIDEVDSVLQGRIPEFSDIPRLKYTRMVIDETMRLYPPAWIVGRTNVEDDVVGGYLIPKGMTILMVTQFVHRHPDYWTEPDKFDPERFSPERAKDIHKYAYFPFGGGPRLCIGNNFALMEMQIVIAMLARSFKLSTVHDTVPELEPLITLRPKGGLEMRFD